MDKKQNRLQAAQARLQAATPGPWCWRKRGQGRAWWIGDIGPLGLWTKDRREPTHNTPPEADAELIVHARNEDLERALAVVEAALDKKNYNCIGCDVYRDDGEMWEHYGDCPLAWWEGEVTE